MLITKADGTLEEFNPAKLRQSLQRSGASRHDVDKIVNEIEKILHEGIQTKEIYKQAFALLKGVESAVIARYAVRRALFGLGPTGFPFETFLAKLYEKLGYNTKTGILLKGKCAEHEIDLAAYKADHSFIAEAKFHARTGLKSDLQVAMYSYARLLDLADNSICSADVCGIKDLKIITNTKFTNAATKYANCVGVELLSWEYPKQGNLYDLIEKTKMYPITVLQSLTISQKRLLIERGIIVTADIFKRPDDVAKLHLSPKKMEALLIEARQLAPDIK